MNAVREVGTTVPVEPLCRAIGLSRATLYRRRRPTLRAATARPAPPRALAPEERDTVTELLTSERFVDRSPAHVVHVLLDEQRYFCSERTMYRILASRDAVHERRSQRVHPKYACPELMATAPNQVWSWDITRLRTLVKWSYLYLYVLLDIFSRFVVGWMVALAENAALAKQLIAETIDKQGVAPGSLIIHADRGAQMTSKTLAQLYAGLDVTASFSRPQVSNDNPFSESQFRTTKYDASFPGKFAGLEDALVWGRGFFPWYNNEHRHSGIGYLTPADVHFGRGEQVLARRHEVMLAAYAATPERFPNGAPKPASLPTAVYINPPASIRAGLQISGGEHETLNAEVRH